MWIVLLDHSGSMGDPFEHATSDATRSRAVEADVKLDAAKEVLREEFDDLRRTNPRLPIAIFGFAGAPALLYEGPIADADAIDRALGGLQARGGTDIAAALGAAAGYKESIDDTDVTQLVLVSDGKSERTGAMAAARRCAECQLALSMLLIDPTDEGLAFARDVVRGVGGIYEKVTSRAELRRATGQVARADARLAPASNGFTKPPHARRGSSPRKLPVRSA